MSDEDPFGLTNDAGRTRIRPVAAPRPASPTPQPPQQQPPFPQAPYAPQSPYGNISQPPPQPGLRRHRQSPNPLISAFAAQLELAPELETANPPTNAETLRVRMSEGLIEARDSAISGGATLSRANEAAWFVAALLDDIVLNTPWGGQSSWSHQPLLVSLSGDVAAGTNFFKKAEDLMRYPDRDRDLLELAYTCIALGFRGKYRVPGRAGAEPLEAAIAAMARMLRDPEVATAPLSPHWRGLDAADEKPRFTVPLWGIAILTVALITAIYVGLGLSLHSRSARLYDVARLLQPTEQAEIFRPDIVVNENPPEPTPVDVTPVSYELLPEFETRLVDQFPGVLEGSDTPTQTKLVLQSPSPEVFQSARASVTPTFLPLVETVAKTIEENISLINRVVVIGHTDTIPVQSSNPFQTNQRLSEARAETMKNLLIEGGVPEDIISTEGRAASEPIADNATREGRAKNRRVEIVLLKGF